MRQSPWIIRWELPKQSLRVRNPINGDVVEYEEHMKKVLPTEIYAAIRWPAGTV